LRKVVVVLTIIAIILTLINAGFNFLLPAYLSYKFHNEIQNGNSIGIIGGADGPTSIYVAGQTFSHTYTVIFALLSIAGVLYLYYSRKQLK